MIKNEHQYRITKAQIKRFEEALKKTKKTVPSKVPALQKAMREGIQSQVGELKEQVEEYESLKNRKEISVELRGIEEIPSLLIKARIAKGLTQAELANLLGLKPQQIQLYESLNYQRASFARLTDIAKALGINLNERVRISTG